MDRRRRLYLHPACCRNTDDLSSGRKLYVATVDHHLRRDTGSIDLLRHHERHTANKLRSVHRPDHGLVYRDHLRSGNRQWIYCKPLGQRYLYLHPACCRDTDNLSSGWKLYVATVDHALRCDTGSIDLLYEQRHHTECEFDPLHGPNHRLFERDDSSHCDCEWIYQQRCHFGGIYDYADYFGSGEMDVDGRQ